jgi:hypothetical protein
MASVRLGLFWRSGPIGILTCTFTHHMTGVLLEYQNSGIGRQVKLAQRDDALSRGMNLIELTFDPVQVRNRTLQQRASRSDYARISPQPLWALGIFLPIAVRNPWAHRSLIAFAAWSSFAHAVAMSILGLEIAGQRVGCLVGSAVLVVMSSPDRAGSGEISCAVVGSRYVASAVWERVEPDN